MFDVIQPRKRRGLVGWPAVLVLASAAGIGCSDPPPLDSGAGTGSASGIVVPIAETPPARTVKAGVFDRGVRGGLPGAGGPYPTLNETEIGIFESALDVFKERDSVSDGSVSDPEIEGSGLGPTFNADACSGCHVQPDVGGTSPAVWSPQQPNKANPQIEVASLEGAANTLPFFIAADGPVREARFKSDGGVHGLFTIAGRTDAQGCNATQPDFVRERENGNLSFRTVLPVFGDGLIENTPDTALEANLAEDQLRKQLNGIAGTFNRSGNDGSIMRFGWKAQNKSLFVFAGEAYNVEQGVSNEMFMNERSVAPGCDFNKTPEDHTPSEEAVTGGPVDVVSDIVSFAIFMRLSAPPEPTVALGEHPGFQVFVDVGCVLCHSDTLTTRMSQFTGMSNVDYHPLSDFALHHMGEDLADGVTQEAAGPDQFRTTPLWGVGQRIFFLHDGRTGDLGEAIEFHDSAGSEAHLVIEAFNRRSSADQQALIDFLRTL
jgi:CxxC motif-containing protein (DUF1111 family)